MGTSNLVLIILVHGIVLGTACYFIGTQKEIGALAAGFLGLILGIIGLVVVLLSPGKSPVTFADQLQKYKALLDSGIITEIEYANLKGRLFEQKIK